MRGGWSREVWGLDMTLLGRTTDLELSGNRDGRRPALLSAATTCQAAQHNRWEYSAYCSLVRY